MGRDGTCRVSTPHFQTRIEIKTPRNDGIVTDSAKLNLGLLHCFVVGMEIGQRVKVYRLRDRVSNAVAQRLGKTGIIQDFKMTDGSGVGAVVLFDDNFSTWFFEDELKLV